VPDEVPAYNEEGLIGRCLASLAAQDYAGPFEVIVVDNGSTDRTTTRAAAHGVRVLHEGRKGICRARQSGTCAARAPLIANLDADSDAAPDWLRRVVARFDADPGVVAIAGAVDYLDAPRWARVQASAFRVANGLAMRLCGGTAFVMASNLAFRRAAFDRVGGYDPALPTIGDEADFLRKLRRIGRVPFDPRLVVRTSARRFRRGFWHFLVVELGYQTIYAALVGRYAGRPPRRARADIREAGAPTHRRWVSLLFGVAAVVAGFLATRPRSQLYGPTIVRGQTDARVVALTFDDGPSAPATAQILGCLRRAGVPATFFLVGANVARHPALARRIVAEGHVVGNHTDRHRWRDAVLDVRAAELDRAQVIIAAAAGVAPRYFRPPYGIHTPWQLRAARRRGLLPVQWGVEANDPHRPGAATIARRILAHVYPGAIILLHDGAGAGSDADRAQTVAALPAIIAGLRRRGSAIVPLPVLIGGKPGRRRD
jgi:peptidoglycan/xylan/chitin deacetylase (PgdA/CDA1 family)/glycosyltransferase involved in cell wall biosynthesis